MKIFYGQLRELLKYIGPFGYGRYGCHYTDGSGHGNGYNNTNEHDITTAGAEVI